MGLGQSKLIIAVIKTVIMRYYFVVQVCYIITLVQTQTFFINAIASQEHQA